MVADDRPRPLSDLPAAAGPPLSAGTQSAAFDVGGFCLDLSASPGAARLVVSGGGSRDTYVVDPAALASWSAAAANLSELGPARTSEDRVEFRTPFLVDREGRASVALEGLVTEGGVAFRLLVSGAAGRIAGVMTSVEVIRGLAEAAAGSVHVARRTV